MVLEGGGECVGAGAGSAGELEVLMGVYTEGLDGDGGVVEEEAEVVGQVLEGDRGGRLRHIPTTSTTTASCGRCGSRVDGRRMPLEVGRRGLVEDGAVEQMVGEAREAVEAAGEQRRGRQMRGDRRRGANELRRHQKTAPLACSDHFFEPARPLHSRGNDIKLQRFQQAHLDGIDLGISHAGHIRKRRVAVAMVVQGFIGDDQRSQEHLVRRKRHLAIQVTKDVDSRELVDIEEGKDEHLGGQEGAFEDLSSPATERGLDLDLPGLAERRLPSMRVGRVGGDVGGWRGADGGGRRVWAMEPARLGFRANHPEAGCCRWPARPASRVHQ